MGVRGINVQMHYDNPKLKEGRTDASVLRLHLTSKPREHEVNFDKGSSLLFLPSLPEFHPVST